MLQLSVNTPPQDIAADALVVPVYSDGSLSPAAQTIDEATEGVITRLMAAKEIEGKAYETTSILAPRGVRATQVMTLGLGDPESADRRVIFRAAGAAAKSLSSRRRETVAFWWDGDWNPEWREAAIAGASVGCVGQDLYRAEKSLFPFDKLLWPESYARAIEPGRIVGDGVNLARRLVNEPPQELYPETFAAMAEQLAQECSLEIEIWDEDKLADQRCGALLAVGRGSARPSRMVILRYQGASSQTPTLGLVGKGVTFDSGGLSIKPGDSMLNMKCDMAGAATVVAALQTIAQLKLPVNVLGVVGLVENMPGSNAYKLGDVVTARNGTTIEVHNTDAEGRLVLADALCVAVDRGADKLIDLATLTGACMVALGTDIAGLMTNHADWCAAVKSAAKRAGEEVWELPMSSDFDEEIKSEVADIKNVGAGRWGGAITAAKLLERFVGDKPWVHIDIAGPSFLDKPKAWIDAGGTGAMVRTLVELARI